MSRFLLRRILEAIPVIVGVATVVFFLLHLVPGDPVDVMLGDSALPAQQEELRAKLHLDEPIHKQYGRYVVGLFRGDFGTSIFTGEPVMDRIARVYPATLFLSFAALLIALLISIPAGLFAASRKNSLWDTATMTGSLIGLSMPAFWLGPILILIFAYRFDLFPLSGKEEALSIVLPAVTLGTGMAALLARMTRSTVIDLLHENFVRTAWAKGLSPRKVWWKHVLRNALLPIVTIVGLQAGALLAGSIITEKVFTWPGIGLELIEAIERRDYPMVQGCVLVISISYVFINLLTDITYGWIDPRVRMIRERS